jgi:DNA-binding PadR family transcriptional regulator
MPPRRRRTNPLALAVLALVIERSMHPYEMASTLRERAKHESIRLNYGSLYAVVEALVRDGLIRAMETERAGRRPERTVYAPTDAGREEFVEWLTELLRKPIKEYPQFEAGLSLMPGLPPDEVARLLAERVERLAEEIAHVRSAVEGAIAQGLPRLHVVEAEYELALREADLAFTRTLAREIADGTLDGIERWKAYHRRK